jgi:NhaA family Na+:H+ antiporter
MLVANSIKFFIRDSRASGILLVCCTLLSMLISNSSIGASYVAFWNVHFVWGKTTHAMPSSMLHIVNDVLMSVFFFMVGMEIKRELLHGELNSVRKATMPLISATGGMLIPALIFLIFCHDSGNHKGWGIPMATDIAFSLGVLSLLGSRVSLSMRIFLTAIAIVDDIGGIVAIAVFYTGSLNWSYILYACLVVAILLCAKAFRRISLTFYLLAGALLWCFIYNSGIHATISGVLLAFLLPSEYIYRLEKSLHLPVNLVILPLFALANTAIILPDDITTAVRDPIHYGVLAGLVIGKPLGIFLFTWLAVKIRVGQLPRNISLRQVLGLGMVAGIGFTVAMFIATLAFPGEQQQIVAKVGVISASVCSGLIGYFFLKIISKKKVRH